MENHLYQSNGIKLQGNDFNEYKEMFFILSYLLYEKSYNFLVYTHLFFLIAINFTDHVSPFIVIFFLIMA